jgi:hypothetical protein
MHTPFHLYEFGLQSFKALATKLNFDISFHEYSVGNIPLFPKILHAPLQAFMKRTNTGMQLTVWLKKK